MQMISIAFVEVDQQKTEPQSYALSYPNGACLSITFGLRRVWTTKTLVKRSSPKLDRMKKSK